MEPNNMPPSQTPNITEQPTGASGQPTPTDASPSPIVPMPKKRRWPLVVTALVVILAAAGAGAYFLTKKDSKYANNAQTSSQSSNESATDSQSETPVVTSLTTTNSPNNQNGTISFTHPASWQVTKKTDKYGTEHTTIKSSLGNSVDMYTRDSVGGACEDDGNTYTLVKRITTQNSSYIFSEYEAPASQGSQALRLEPYFDQSTPAHKALAEGQSNTGLCQNIAHYPIAKDIQVTINNSDGNEAHYSDIKGDVKFIEMLQSFNVTDD